MHKATGWQAPCFAHLAESGTRRTKPEVSLTPSIATTASHRCARRVPRLGLNMPAEKARSGGWQVHRSGTEGHLQHKHIPQKWPLIQPYGPQLTAALAPAAGVLAAGVRPSEAHACLLRAILRYVCQHGGQAPVLLTEA